MTNTEVALLAQRLGDMENRLDKMEDAIGELHDEVISMKASCAGTTAQLVILTKLIQERQSILDKLCDWRFALAVGGSCILILALLLGRPLMGSWGDLSLTTTGDTHNDNATHQAPLGG